MNPIRRFVLIGGGALALAGVAVTHSLRRSAALAAAAEAEAPPIGAFVDAPQRLHYVERGTGRPIVFLHGASGNLRDWTTSPVFAAAAERGRAIAVDRPGFGYSDPSADPKPWLLQGQTAALRRALAALGVAPEQRLVLVGHSWSGALILRWALAHPAQVAGVVCVAGVTSPWPGGVGALYDALAAPVVGPIVAHGIAPSYGGEFLERALRNIFAPNPVPEDYAARIGAALALRPGTLRFNAKALTQLNPVMAELYPRYGDITAPIEALHGLADRILPYALHAEGLRTAAPRARITPLADVGHMPHHVAPEAVIAALDRILNKGHAGSTDLPFVDAP